MKDEEKVTAARMSDVRKSDRSKARLNAGSIGLSMPTLKSTTKWPTDNTPSRPRSCGALASVS